MNGQIEREYREALDELRFSGEAKARMAEKLATGQDAGPVKGKRLRPLRAGLIAAAACVLLVGTAFAATAVYQLTVRTYDDRVHDGELLVGYDVYGEASRYSLGDFSQELQDDYNAWNRRQGGILPGRSFDNWEDAKAYLGDDIPCIWWDTSGVLWESEYRVQAIPDLSRDTDNLQFVQVYNNARLDWHVTCETVIYAYGEEQSSDRLFGMAGSTDTDFQVLGDYPMANGCIAQVVTEVRPFYGEDWSSTQCIGFFMKSGILYEVSLYSSSDLASPPEMEAQLHQVLDSFD